MPPGPPPVVEIRERRPLRDSSPGRRRGSGCRRDPHQRQPLGRRGRGDGRRHGRPASAAPPPRMDRRAASARERSAECRSHGPPAPPVGGPGPGRRAGGTRHRRRARAGAGRIRPVRCPRPADRSGGGTRTAGVRTGANRAAAAPDRRLPGPVRDRGSTGGPGPGRAGMPPPSSAAATSASSELAPAPRDRRRPRPQGDEPPSVE